MVSRSDLVMTNDDVISLDDSPLNRPPFPTITSRLNEEIKEKRSLRGKTTVPLNNAPSRGTESQMYHSKDYAVSLSICIMMI